MDNCSFLDQVYNAINEGLFDGGLDKPLLIPQRIGTSRDGEVLGMYLNPEAEGGFGVSAIYVNPNVSEEVGERTGSGTYYVMVETLVHEMTHYYNYLQGIEDTDGEGRHNERFREAALAHGQECEEAGNGKSATALTLEGYLAIADHLDEEILELLDEQ